MPSPSPSPNSRKNSSSITPRNLSGSTRSDLPGPTRGLLQGTGFSSSSASRLYERSDDHKENSTENGNGRGIQGRSLQNLRGASKKPWVTHFSKPAGTLSPSNRILVDRNSSCSPLRSGILVRGEGLGDQKLMTTPPREREEAPATPGPVKGVAELSKRIQQFLEEQDVVLGIKTGSGQEETSSFASVESPVELGQRTVSSPYNPYKSPFFERPKFLRLNGSASSTDELDVVSASTDVVGTAMEQPTEELPLFEGDQVLATPLQQIQFSINLSPLSAEDDDVAHGEKFQEQLSDATLEEASVDASKANQLVSDSKQNYSHDSSKKTSEGIIIPSLLAKCFENQSQVGDMEIETSDGEEDGVLKSKIEAQSRDMASAQPEGKEDGTFVAEYESASHSQAENTKTLQGQEDAAGHAKHQFQPEDFERQQQSASSVMHKKEASPEISIKSQSCEELEDVDEEECWGKRVGRLIFCGTLLAAFVTLVLLASAGPGLLPSSLIKNPVQSFWHSSKYHGRSMLFVHGMEGLWSTENVHLPADARVALKRGVEMLHSISRLSTQARLELQTFAQITLSIFDDWWKVLLQHLSLRTNPDSDLGKEERGRQFEWLQDYEFEEEWLEEISRPVYTDWELLHEYDLGAANQFVLGSIPEVLKNDLWRNFSRLSNSPEVKGLLEDLMKLKGGNTEEDRLEVLQYFWEYTRFSASAHETLMKSQVVNVAMENGSSHQESCLDLPGVESTEEQSTGGPDSYIPVSHGPDSLTLPGVNPSEEQSADGPTYSEEQQKYQADGKPNEVNLNERAGVDSSIVVIGGPHACNPSTDGPDSSGLESPEEQSTDGPNFSKKERDHEAEHLHKAARSAALVAQVGIQSEERFDVVLEVTESSMQLQESHQKIAIKHFDVVLEVTESSMQLQESHQKLPSNIPAVNENEWTEEMKIERADMLITKIQPAYSAKFDVAHLATFATFLVVSMFILARSRLSKRARTLTAPVSSSVQFLRKTDQLQENLDGDKDRQRFIDAKQDQQQVTMIEELNDTFTSVLQSPEPNWLPPRSPETRTDEDVLRSPIPASISSPYGSFTTYKLMSKKEGQAVETKLTPVRRSSRIRNHTSMSPQTNAVKRIAISPP